MATTESWVLQGLDVSAWLLELDAPPPKERAEMVSAADSEFAAVVRQPLHENRVITMKLRVPLQASMDAALDQVGALVDRLRSASRTFDGIPLVWTPANSSRTRTFDVLRGEITEMPIGLDGQARSWFVQRPIITVELTCKPYWYATETLSSTVTAATPLVTIEIAGITGDAPALGRLIVTDNASLMRRDVEWGLENQFYNSGTSLIIESDNMVTSGFSGTGTTRSGAYDPGAAGNSVIRIASVLPAPTAVCGTGTLSHVGTFRVWGRFFFAAQTQMVRLTWRVGDGSYATNQWAMPPSPAASQWGEVDLGLITIPVVEAGTQRWDGRIETYDAAPLAGTPAALDVDYLMLVPAGEGYGRARAAYSYSPGVAVGYDQFTSITAGTVLNARAAPLGGTWATSGATTDFAAVDPAAGGEMEARTTTTDSASTGRYAILGATNYTDTEVSVDTSLAGNVNFTAATMSQAVIARWVDSSNYLVLELRRSTATHTLLIAKFIAGVPTTIAAQNLIAPIYSLHRLRLIVYTSGRAVGQLTDGTGNMYAQVSTTDTQLATGGTLATGKPGMQDINLTGSAITRYYDNFVASTPGADVPVMYASQSMEFRYDSTIREDSAGTFYGIPPSYRGGRFFVPPGTSRVAVKTRRWDMGTSPADAVTDSTIIQVGTTPRGIAVPR